MGEAFLRTAGIYCTCHRAKKGGRQKGDRQKGNQKREKGYQKVTENAKKKVTKK